MYQVFKHLTNFSKHGIALTIFCCLVVGTASAQRGKLRQANKLMERKNYQGAIELYLKVLDKNDDSEAKINIAECYYILDNQHESEYWYGQVVLLPQADPVAMKRYAQALQQNEKCTEAKEWYKRYLDINPADMSAQMGLKSCNESVINNLKAYEGLYDVRHLEKLCSADDDFGPSYFQDKIVFVTNRYPGIEWDIKDATTERFFTNLFSVDATLIDPDSFIYNYSKPKQFSKKLNSKYHDGPASFASDGASVYFSRNSTDGRADDGTVRQKIYKSESQGGAWGKPASLPFNSDEYNVCHPTLSEDQLELYFTSDMPGGFGGMDLYVSYLENGRWSPPVNLGPTINTEGDEVFPFIHADRTLYFASDGHVGLGGLDVYYVKEEIGGIWGNPTNMGSPVNSGSDDFSLVINSEKTHGYFASNRDGGVGGDDLYSFVKLSVEVEITVFSKNDNIPIEGAEVYVSCSPVESFTTSADGKVMTELAMDKACDFAAEKFGYKPNSVRKGTEGLKAGAKLFVQIPLEVERVYDIVGTVKDEYADEFVPGALVTLVTFRDGEKDSISVPTDADGKYQFADIEEGTDCRIKVFKTGYTEASVSFTTGEIDGDEDIVTRDLVINCNGGPNCPDPKIDPDTIEPLCVGCTVEVSGDTIIHRGPDGEIIKITVNGEDEFIKPVPGQKRLLNIYYDFNSAKLRRDAYPALDTLLAFLEEYPDAVIELSSHTDARGTKQYNKRLSRRRAESVGRFLKKNGIDRKRIKGKGMGEEVMVNGCYDGQECSEAEHQENRRTEFHVVSASGRQFDSQKPDNIRVNPCRGCDPIPAVEDGEPTTDVEPDPNEFTTEPEDDGPDFIEFTRDDKHKNKNK
ncbi:MAG: OmpA family protein [Saprospiraceae bacterium]|nr:OmpA family protein [Saprospiraceae bacterium]